MAEFDNELRGALFPNDSKKSANHPDYKGSLQADGIEYWASAWIKEARGSGKRYLSIALTPKDDNQSPQRASGTGTPSAEDFLAQNQAKIDAHKTAQSAPRAPNRPAPAQDFDSFDDDVPF